jgi:hypothetical protein
VGPGMSIRQSLELVVEGQLNELRVKYTLED